MRRLDFSLPDFCRINWASESARAHWEPGVARCAQFWHRLELETVLAGLRPVGLVSAPERELSALMLRCVGQGMEARPLYSFSPKTNYISDFSPLHAGASMLMFAVGRAQDAKAAEAAFRQNKSSELALLLGYPSCCAAFFSENWDRQRFIDTTWKMAEPDRITAHDLTVTAHPQAELNLLLRWLGIRPVFHLPCSFACEPSITLARDIAAFAHRIGGADEIEMIYDILRWPVQWSALHGIAEIETPVLRISTRTDATPVKYTVRLSGVAASIAHAASGNRFPYAPPSARRKTRSIRTAPRPRNEPEAEQWLYVDNGFRNLSDMQQAFEPVTRALAVRSPGSVMHLACRNGALLHLAAKTRPNLSLAGIDSDAARIARARQILPAHAERFLVGRVNDPALPAALDPADAYVVMAGRLLEMPMERSNALLSTMLDRGGAVLIYAFDDWLRQQSLAQMAARLNRKLASDGVVTSLAAAAWLAF